MDNARADLTNGHDDVERISRTPFPSTAAGTSGARGNKPAGRGKYMTGRVVQIFYGQGHGFIRARDRRQLFFHRSDVLAAGFNALAVGNGVAFELIEDKLAGPRAVNVKRAVGKRRNR
jgi:cold shock CspA family protein